MKRIAMSAFALIASTGVAFSQHNYVEPSDVARGTVVRHSFLAKRNLKLSHEKQRSLDAAHKAALSKIPNRRQPTDPWAKVR
jgi:hypothetical protein